ncbi:MAG: hypothetical protein EP330_12990 [Deltaproteobacteria bacterium]|nr:MAG: hypothetical protein EP330_12990 [Deltaproteobacteria bacterium]
MLRPLPLLLLVACGGGLPDADNPMGLFSMRWEPVLDASEDMDFSFGEDRAWVVVDEELTVYDAEWTQIMRVGDVQAVGAVLDIGVWLTNGLVLRSEAGSGGSLLTLPTELGTPIDIRRGDGGELWILGEASTGGAIASSTDGGNTWIVRATELTAGGELPETLKLRSTLGGVTVVDATNTTAGTSSTWKVTGSGAEEWLDGAFLEYPAARIDGGWVGNLVDRREQYDATPVGYADSWAPDAADGWAWTHAVGIDLSPERVPLTVVGADANSIVYAHDTVTLYRTTTAFSPDNDQTADIEPGYQCSVRHRIDWTEESSGLVRDSRVRNGFTEEVWLYEIAADGLVPLHDDAIAPESGADVAVGLERWMYVADADGTCLYMITGKDMTGGDFWIEPR